MSQSFWCYCMLLLAGVVVVLVAIFSDNPNHTTDLKNLTNVARTVTGTLIPLKAHFVYGLWDTSPLPLKYKKCIQGWRDQGWEIKVWNKFEVEEVLREYPVWWTLYQNFDRRVQAADLARYVIVYDQGGFYFDCDCSPGSLSLKDHLLTTGYDWTSVFFIENFMPNSWIRTTAHRFPIREGINEKHERLANFSFGAVAQHPVLLTVLHTVENRCRRNPGKMDDYGVLYTTGPDAVTDALAEIRSNYSSTELQIISHSDYMTHHATGTWRNAQDRP